MELLTLEQEFLKRSQQHKINICMDILVQEKKEEVSKSLEPNNIYVQLGILNTVLNTVIKSMQDNTFDKLYEECWYKYTDK